MATLLATHTYVVHVAVCVNLLMAINSFFFFFSTDGCYLPLLLRLVLFALFFMASTATQIETRFTWWRSYCCTHTHTLKICVITAKKINLFNFARFFGLYLFCTSLPSSVHISQFKTKRKLTWFALRARLSNSILFSILFGVVLDFFLKTSSAALVYDLVKANFLLYFQPSSQKCQRIHQYNGKLLQCECVGVLVPCDSAHAPEAAAAKSLLVVVTHNHTHSRTHTLAYSQTPCKFFFFVLPWYFWRRHPTRSCCLENVQENYLHYILTGKMR